MKSETKKHPLHKFAAAYGTHDVRVRPEYQRGTVWKLPQKQGLIDSLLRGYQIPLIYVHLEQRAKLYGGTETTAWLVDGQQRLAAIYGFLQNEYALPDPRTAKPNSVLPPSVAPIPPWAGKKFDELTQEEKDRLRNIELQVVEMTAEHPNEVRDLFIRLQAGTPLTAQEKRDAWPGDFTDFVIKHAGKPGHRLSNPKPFFSICHKQRSKPISVDDGAHYVDGLAETRKFFAGLAMTIMVREKAGADFVDLKGTTINDFYIANLILDEGDLGTKRVVDVLDTAASLPNWERLKQGKALSFQWAFHFALLVDVLSRGGFAQAWRGQLVEAFLAFRTKVAEAQLHYRKNRESLPHHEKFGRLLSGSGSDTAEVIRIRHAFLLSQVYAQIKPTPLDPHRLFDPLEKEVIWNRDRGTCQCPSCERPDRAVSFADARVHHVVEHCAGGQTKLENGVLVCPECHSSRVEMQKLEAHFKAYLARIYSGQPGGAGSDTQEGGSDSGTLNGNGGGTHKHLRIEVDWGALDVDREVQVIEMPQSSQTIVTLLTALVREFGTPMIEQLQEHPIIRFPLAADPQTAFVNPANGSPFSAIKVPGTNLYFCPHSSTEEKERRLRELFGRLTLPDERGFPEGSIEITVVGGTEA